jgi:hypothetical protein
MTEKLVSARFGPGPFSLEGLAELVRSLGEVEGNDLRPLAAKLGVNEDSFHIKAVADLLGISDEPRELPELYSAIRRLLRAEAPVTVVFEDVGAAGPAFFNLLQYLEETLEDDRVIIELRGDPDAPHPITGSPDDLFRAGARSLRRSDMPAADAFLAAAADLFPPGDRRWECIAGRCDALLAGGRVDETLEAAALGLEEASRAEDPRFVARFSFFTTILGGGPGDLGTALTEIASTLEAHGDRPGAAQVVEAKAHLAWDSGDSTAALRLMDGALDHARTGGDRQTATRIVAWFCDVIGDGSLEESGSRSRIEDLAWVASFSPLVEVKRLVTLARLEARAGWIAAARALMESAIVLQEDLGQPGWVAGVTEATDEIERLAGNGSEQTTSEKDV